MKQLLIVMIILLACSPSVKPPQQSDSNALRPDWLLKKPDQSTYYIGIGRGSKMGTHNYIQEAKKSALEDLVSEIKVNVSGTSVLSQLDANEKFQEKYEQIIRTTVADEIEEFERVDSWQNDQSYWVFYRLSKQRYREIKEEQKRNAVMIGIDFFTKAKEAEKKGDLSIALGFYYQGFRAIQKYLAEPIQIEIEGKKILLTNEIIAKMQLLMDKIILSVTPSQLLVNRRISLNKEEIVLKAQEKGSKKPVYDLPLNATFEKGAGNVFPTYTTNLMGKSMLLLSKITSRDLEQQIAIKMNPLSYAGQSATKIDSLIVQKMVLPTTSLLLKVQRPLIFISAIERNFGEDKGSRPITNTIKNYLTKAGFEFVSDKNKADLLINVQSDCEKGPISGSIYITYHTSTIRVYTSKDNKELYATSLNQIKGYSLNYERSSQDAQHKASEVLNKEKIPELLNSILE